MAETQRPTGDDYMPEVREPAGYRRTDSDIAREIRERLADDVGLDSSGIEIEVRGCEVTMRGVVRHCADAKRAQTHACVISGVKIVRDELQPREPRSDAVTEPLGGAAAKMGKPNYER
jgi:osmotically-inducible protein OsmY